MVKPCCAICADEVDVVVQRPLGRDDAMVNVCTACDEEPPREVFGPELGFEPSGGMLTHEQTTEAMRKLMGSEYYERTAEFERRFGQAPAHAMTAEEREFAEFNRETQRRIRTGASSRLGPRSGQRQKKIF